jgi:hypothetical protein
MDQAQHFTGTAAAATHSTGDDVGTEFRSGLDAIERERMYSFDLDSHLQGLTLSLN